MPILHLIVKLMGAGLHGRRKVTFITDKKSVTPLLWTHNQRKGEFLKKTLYKDVYLEKMKKRTSKKIRDWILMDMNRATGVATTEKDGEIYCMPKPSNKR